jgi:hypothetical protein
VDALLQDGLAWAKGYSLALSLLLFFPAIVAFLRSHPRRWRILILVFSLGWTGVGWLVALIWSLSSRGR